MTNTPDEQQRDGHLRRLAAKAFVFAAALAILGYGFERPSIANAIPDPISRFRAQDEALYSHSALTMARSGDWLTPHFLGRLLLYKPPLLAWLAGISIKIWGTSLFALRLPALLAGALGAVLVFAWHKNLGAGALAVLLIASDPFWHTFSRLCQTDILHAAFLTGAMLCLACDPKLSRRSSFWGFAILSALGIMVKSVSGLLAPLGLLVYWAMARHDEKPTKRRLLSLFLAIAALAAPWHIYQLVVHTKWFWADYVQVQLLNYGLRPPSQVSSDGAAMFYLRRLWLADPVLCLLALCAAPWFAKAAWRRTSSNTIILVAWTAVILVALLLFQYRSVHYLASVVPPLCLIASQYGPMTKRSARNTAIIALCAAFLAKVVYAGTWSLPYGQEAPNPTAAVLRDYYEKGRGNGLILVQPDDDFYSAALPGLDVRYCFIDPAGPRNFPWHFLYLGIVLTADQYIDTGAANKQYVARLADWGVTSHQPIGTVIIALRNEDILKLARAQPERDFLLPSALRGTAEEIARSEHDLASVDAHLLLILSKKAIPAAHPKLPRYW